MSWLDFYSTDTVMGTIGRFKNLKHQGEVMEKRFNDEDILKVVDESKRDFIKKVVVGTAFAVPVINSFSMDGLKIRMGMEQAGAFGPKPPPVSSSIGGGTPSETVPKGEGGEKGKPEKGSGP
jgi:hypothetical protein